MSDELNVVIGTCDRCGRDIRTNEPRHKVNGLWEHDDCPIVTLHHFEPDPAA